MVVWETQGGNLNIVIDKEFRNLIPPLTEAEQHGLETSIMADGCRDALIVWAEEGILLDGHHRKEICDRLNIEYRIETLSFPSREEAADWVDANQLGRRNLTPDQASLIRGRRYNRTKGSRADNLKQNAPKGHFVPSVDQSERLAKEHGVTGRTIKRDGQFAAAVESIKSSVPDIEERVMAGDIPSKQAVIEAARKPETAQEKLKPHIAQNSGENEWYTPAEYIEAALKTMGGIDLDPASTIEANKIVKATKFYTKKENGLESPWSGKIWMNPPYAQPLIRQFCDKLAEEVEVGNVTQAIVLVNNATETEWFQRVMSLSTAICFPRGRVKFWAPGKTAAPLQGQAVLYIGDKSKAFADYFTKFGTILTQYE